MCVVCVVSVQQNLLFNDNKPDVIKLQKEIRATARTESEVYDLLDEQAKVSDMNSALSYQVEKSYVNDKLDLKANNATRYTKDEVNHIIVRNVPKSRCRYRTCEEG